MIPLRKPIVRTGNFVGKVRVLEPMKSVDGRCRIIPFPKPGPRRDASLWKVRTCQWIEGEPKGHSHEAGLMCGCPVEDGKSYCPDHCRRAYVRTRPLAPSQIRQHIDADIRNGSREMPLRLVGPDRGYPLYFEDAAGGSQLRGEFDTLGVCGE